MAHIIRALHAGRGRRSDQGLTGAAALTDQLQNLFSDVAGDAGDANQAPPPPPLPADGPQAAQPNPPRTRSRAAKTAAANQPAVNNTSQATVAWAGGTTQQNVAQGSGLATVTRPAVATPANTSARNGTRATGNQATDDTTDMLRQVREMLQTLVEQQATMAEGQADMTGRMDLLVERMEHLEETQSQPGGQRTQDWVRQQQNGASATRLTRQQLGDHDRRTKEPAADVVQQAACTITTVPARAISTADDRTGAPQQVGNGNSSKAKVRPIDEDNESPERLSRRGITIRPYKGTSNIYQYLMQFESQMELGGWPTEQWGARLIGALEDEATSILTVETLPKRPPYEKVADLLKARFGSEATPTLWKSTLESRKRGEKESLHKLSHNILELVGKAFPKLDMTTRREMAASYFTNALTDQQQREHVRRLLPENLDAALQEALAFENARKIEERSHDAPSKKIRAVTIDGDGTEEAHPNPQQQGQRKRDKQMTNQDQVATSQVRAIKEGTDLKQLTDTLTELRESLQAMKAEQDRTGSAVRQLADEMKRRPAMAPRPPPTGQPGQHGTTTAPATGPTQRLCYNCGAPNHFIRDCPEPRRQRGGPQQPNQGNGAGRGPTERVPGPQQQQ